MCMHADSWLTGKMDSESHLLINYNKYVLGVVHEVCHAPRGRGLRKCDSLWQGDGRGGGG